MAILGQAVRMLKRAAFADTLLPQEFTVGLVEPQREISVWLHGAGTPCDVTGRHTTACTAPLILCVGWTDEQPPGEKDLQSASLRFCEGEGQRRVLGEIRLRYWTTVTIGTSAFILFRVRGSTNFCLPRLRLWAHYSLHAYSQWRRTDPPDMKMTLLEQRAAAVTFIRPHPLCLVSVGDKTTGNIFTMNLMGDLGHGYVGFGLREQRRAAHLVESGGRLAISGLPIDRCSLAFRLAANHKKTSIDWDELPFETTPSTVFRIPVPVFATRVREMHVETSRKLGSHRFFIARTISDESHEAGPQACVVHGFYQCWRLKGENLQPSIAADRMNKRGT